MKGIHISKTESDPVFIKFLEANGLIRTGIDFGLKTGIYESERQPKNEPYRFTGIELTTAYAGFSDGYCGNPPKNSEPFGRPKRKRNGEDTEIETLLANEKSITALLGPKPELRGEGVTEEVCQGALNVTRYKIYAQQYLLGRRANHLNETKRER